MNIVAAYFLMIFGVVLIIVGLIKLIPFQIHKNERFENYANNYFSNRRDNDKVSDEEAERFFSDASQWVQKKIFFNMIIPVIIIVGGTVIALLGAVNIF